MTTPQHSLMRPDWQHSDYHREQWLKKGVTVLICQRKTKNETRLCLQSLLRFYPDIPILVVDGNSQDDSLLYLKYMAITHANITLWERPSANTNDLTSHGVTMNQAIHGHINTRYVLLLDSDTIVDRGGFIEGMLEQFAGDGKMYATGTLMLVSRKNDACGPPHDETDVLRYAHPSCALYDADAYKKMNVPFVDHGAPCCYNMKTAEQLGLTIGYYPIEKYVSHLSGTSWVKPRIPIWNHDHDTPLRPFITFVVNNCDFAGLEHQTDRDFDIIIRELIEQHHVVIIHNDAIHDVTNGLYPVRFNILGEYVCVFPQNGAPVIIQYNNLVHDVKLAVIEQQAPDELTVGGLLFIRRNLWQQKKCF